jgi:hypothetical protein
MNQRLYISFLSIVALVAIAAWEPRPRHVVQALASCGMKRISTIFTIVWIAIAIIFGSYFHKTAEFWQLSALLAEIAGAIYLAREVFIAQQFEEYERVAGELESIVDLEALIEQGKYREYITQYYQIGGGMTAREVEDYLSTHNSTLSKDVRKLALVARKSYERPKTMANPTFKYRRMRLLRGIFLVVLGLAGDGLLVLTHHDSLDLTPIQPSPTQVQLVLDNLLSQNRNDRTELQEQLRQFELSASSQKKEIEFISVAPCEVK